MEHYNERNFAKMAGDHARQPPDVDGGKDMRLRRSTSLMNGYLLVEDHTERELRAERQAYTKRLEAARKLTGGEYFSGNIDYVHVLMEKPDEPAEVPDIAITDIIATSTGIRHVMVAVVSVYWIFNISIPFTSDITCHGGVPLVTIWAFVFLAAMNCFMQIWCAALTKYGYLMLANAPQLFISHLGYSVMGLFNSYSNISFVLMARSCGSPLWRPAAAIYVIGVLLAQAVPGILLLAYAKYLPIALKVNQLNLLLVLLKPHIT